MSENLIPLCSECDDVESVDRRDFMRLLGGAAAGAVVPSSLTPVSARAETKKPEKAERKDSPAEALVKELFAGMNDDQKKQVVAPFTDSKRTALNPNRAIGTPIATS